MRSKLPEDDTFPLRGWRGLDLSRNFSRLFALATSEGARIRVWTCCDDLFVCGAVAQKLTAAMLSVMKLALDFSTVCLGWSSLGPRLVSLVSLRTKPSHGCQRSGVARDRESSSTTAPACTLEGYACSRSLIALCGMYFEIIYGWYFFLTWLPNYLMKARGFDLKAAGWLAMWPLLCMAAGVAFGGGLSDVLIRRWGSLSGRRTPGLIGLPLAEPLSLGQRSHKIRNCPRSGWESLLALPLWALRPRGPFA